MKDANGKEIKVGDRIRRASFRQFAIAQDPVIGSQVIVFPSRTCIQTDDGVYIAETCEVIDDQT